MEVERQDVIALYLSCCFTKQPGGIVENPRTNLSEE